MGNDIDVTYTRRPESDEKLRSLSSQSRSDCQKNQCTDGGHDFDSSSAFIDERKLMIRVDCRVLPILCVLYFLAFLDRVNIGNVVAFGIEEDLNMNPLSNQLSTALTIFFVPYVLCQVPSNLLLKRLKPHIWLPGCMFFFGLIMICQGLGTLRGITVSDVEETNVDLVSPVKNYSGLLTARFFLGLAESGTFPGCFYLIGMWYKRIEAQRRFSFFFGSTTLAGAFGSLLASAIGNMNGMRGYHAWRWIFILEGVLTCVVAFVTFFLITDFPEDAKWLSENEKAFVKARLRTDQGVSGLEQKISFRDVGEVISDYKTWLGTFTYFGLIVPAYGFAYFSPTIIESYGYSAIETQLHNVAPAAAAFVAIMLLATASDFTNHRYLYLLLANCISLAGTAILLSVHTDHKTEYAAVFLVAVGIYSAMPITICWFSMNQRGHRRRAVATGVQIGVGEIGGIISTFLFPAKDAPLWRTGYGVVMAMLCLSFVMGTGYFLACWRENNFMGSSEEEEDGVGRDSSEFKLWL